MLDFPDVLAAVTGHGSLLSHVKDSIQSREGILLFAIPRFLSSCLIMRHAWRCSRKKAAWEEWWSHEIEEA